MALSDLVLVMNAGKVEQQGTPFELFTKPKNKFVAKFIGGHNVIEQNGHFQCKRRSNQDCDWWQRRSHKCRIFGFCGAV